MQKYLAEFLGTFALVFFGTGAIVVNEQFNGVITHAGVALTFGMVVTVMIYALGNISGAHMNPAVTLVFALAKRFPSSQVLPYVGSQAAGAFLASLLLKYLFPASHTLGATLPAGSSMQSFVLEFFLSFFLMLVIFNVASGGKEQGLFAGLAVGFTVLLEAMFAGPVSGASMNPIRSLSPALLSGHTESIWIYLVAPTAGAAFAIPVYKLLHPHTKTTTQRQ